MKLLPWQVKRDLVTKVDEETDPAHGVTPQSREISKYISHGILNLDKPSGPTSHEVVAWVKKILKIDHAGHGGTLDPRVTGVLPVALQEATKIAQVFLYSGKEYICVMRLHSTMPRERVQEVIDEFVGEIYQRPPLRSSVARRLRRRTIYYIQDVEFLENRVLFRVGCQAGTYIRKLCFDIGEALGCGAHMEELRRTRAGPLAEDEDLITLYDLYEAYHLWTEGNDESKLRTIIQPMENALTLVPKIFLRDSAVDSICHGANLAVPGIAKFETGIRKKGVVGLFTLKGELVALARALMTTEEIEDKERGITTDTLRGIMAPGTYPRLWRKRSRKGQG
ncbi:MAG: RNA-guided pseudouridylation complex pseudouridine synthase subunit Cbf5 [Candidatus Bathyarchaeota archaeon]|nr:RNA-guided pseudouridylation complex pseudouridine synthase subunit Cbf5 [Candidatus Bathyarchaeota archaeon]